MSAKLAMSDAGIASDATEHDSEVPDEDQDHEAGEQASGDQVLLERRDRRLDEVRSRRASP